MNLLEFFLILKFRSKVTMQIQRCIFLIMRTYNVVFYIKNTNRFSNVSRFFPTDATPRELCFSWVGSGSHPQ